MCCVFVITFIVYRVLFSALDEGDIALLKTYVSTLTVIVKYYEQSSVSLTGSSHI